MNTIRLLLFVFFPISALSFLVATDIRSNLVFTGDWRDIAVCGKGYFQTIDMEGTNRIWSRSVRLAVDNDCSLGTRIDGEFRRIEPYVCILNYYEKVDIDKSGNVSVQQNGEMGFQTVGVLGVTTFSGDEQPDTFDEVYADEYLGAPVESQAGEQGAGYIMQGYTYEYCLPLTLRTGMAFAFCSTWFLFAIRQVKRNCV